MTDWTISVVDSIRVKGKPPNWMPSAKELLEVGVPLRVARRWKRARYEMMTALRRRVKQDRN